MKFPVVRYLYRAVFRLFVVLVAGGGVSLFSTPLFAQYHVGVFGGGNRCVVDDLVRAELIFSGRAKPKEINETLLRKNRSNAEAAYDTLGMYKEGIPRTEIVAPAGLTLLYWDVGQNKSCLENTGSNVTTESFIDFNLQKILRREARPELDVPSILVLDNCSNSCDSRNGLNVFTNTYLADVYRSEFSGLNCEYIPKTSISGQVGTCIYWVKELKRVPMTDTADKSVDWVPFTGSSNYEFKARETFRKVWLPKIAQTLGPSTPLPSVDRLMHSRFSPRIFETKAGSRIHVIPASVNRHLGNPAANLGSGKLNAITNLLGSFKPGWKYKDTGWIPMENNPEILVHNQVRRLGWEFKAYTQNLSAQNQKDSGRNLVFMLGNFQVPSGICAKPDSGITYAPLLAVNEAREGGKDLLRVIGSDFCTTPTAATEPKDLVVDRTSYSGSFIGDNITAGLPRSGFELYDHVGLQNYHAYFFEVNGQKTSPSVNTHNYSGSKAYPFSIHIPGLN